MDGNIIAQVNDSIGNLELREYQNLVEFIMGDYNIQFCKHFYTNNNFNTFVKIKFKGGLSSFYLTTSNSCGD